MKKIIQSVIGGALILVAAFFLFKKLSESKKAPKKGNQHTTTKVLVQSVANKTLPISITSTGAVQAKQRLVLYSEVTGLFQSSANLYKPGVAYKRGQTLLRINNSEFAATVQAQRINYKSLVIATLADIQFDYPEELSKWQRYAASIVADKQLPSVPSTTNETFKNYLSSKSIYTNYYSIKNLETRLGKYSITAPYNGVLVSADVTPGTLVSPGQKLGEYVAPGVYELELNVSAGLADFLTLHKKVTLYSTDHSKKYEGVVSRINSKIDKASQTIQMFVEIKSDDLVEGAFLEADIEAQEVSQVTEIDRNLLIDHQFVYVVQEGVLVKQPVVVVHSDYNKLIVKGLRDGAQLVTSTVPGGFEGMQVAIKQPE